MIIIYYITLLTLFKCYFTNTFHKIFRMLFHLVFIAGWLMMFIVYYITLLTLFNCYFTNTIHDCSNVVSSCIYCRLVNDACYLLYYCTNTSQVLLY